MLNSDMKLCTTEVLAVESSLLNAGLSFPGEAGLYVDFCSKLCILSIISVNLQIVFLFIFQFLMHHIVSLHM